MTEKIARGGSRKPVGYAPRGVSGSVPSILLARPAVCLSASPTTGAGLRSTIWDRRSALRRGGESDPQHEAAIVAGRR